MSGSIFVVSEDNKILELKESKYENEAIFQELIEKYPNNPSNNSKNVDTRSKLYILFSLVLILLFLKYIIIISNV